MSTRGRRKANDATKRKISGKKVATFIGRCLASISVTLLMILLTLIIMIFLICHGPSQKATELFTTTFLETGQMKFIVSMFLSEDKIKEIVANNSMSEMTAEVNTDLITVEENSADTKDIELVEIPGNTFHAKMLIIKDPARVKIATTYPWGEYGQELDQLVKNSGAVAGINGGLYVSDSNKGGRPLGLVVCDGKIQYNNPTGYAGLHLIGFDTNNILRIISLEGMNATQIEKLVQDENIRDAVVFQEESSDKNNHFVKLVVNGEARQMNGSGSGANPRTVIGQRKDGAVLLLVTDGRGAAGHLGATASDLIDIMLEYGAVNAANLDGGSSSSMYYNDQYEMTSVTLYYSNSSWKLPTAFVVK
ncbi:MAG: phosphodiester glycosidase family protein [Clostridia bacterium]|nr:phosphodiester glycosidase family protein [Clostridia bacterium]